MRRREKGKELDMIRKVNGHTVEYIPNMKKCSYYHKGKDGVCKNCNDTRKYIDGYYMIIDGKIGWMVDTLGK